jgi:tRNA(Ile2) C34 agmatinyltransferase TiaS
MEPLTDPYTITYPQITAVTDREGSRVELIEFFDCVGGAMWARHHYAQSPLVRDARCVGNSMRYLLEPGEVTLALSGSRFPAGISEVRVSDAEIQVSYLGMGGGGVGASICRAKAPGVARCRYDESGGGRVAGASIWLPRRERVLIGVVEDEQNRYLSHTIVQLYPVAFRTKNCVSTVCEFATADAAGLIARFRRLLEEYTLSPHTGMAVYQGFDPSPLGEFGWKAKRGQVSEEDLHRIRDADLSIILSGRGKVGAVAALPFYTRFEEALELCSG